ncbi:protoporphyrinogen oxidase, chloroplastic isoform X3 [Cornus florida]|uniref:protoporphyrinogen oxidase, chloroplastic isoform X3 n=1 Tax=Cornus florida TaxID=4283 RepID=UPI0028A29EC4|nr:protoporphyrinogen oxidase, chloroplastic isoform X3 [Cornus florida]
MAMADLPWLACSSHSPFPAAANFRRMRASSSTHTKNRPLPSLSKSYGWRGRFRCSMAATTAVTPSKVGAEGGEPVLDCVIVGGGISGLCIAQALNSTESAPNVIVTEARDRAGGNITTLERDGYLWEEGPNSFQPSDTMLTMLVDSGLKDDLVLGDPNAPRFVLWDGKLRPVPSKPTDLPFFDLMSLSGKLRAGFGALGLRPPPPGHEESVEEFVRRNLGDEVFERLIEPFCSGVYAGDPSKLSMKAAFGKVWKLEQNGGSIIGGTFKAIRERTNGPKPPRDPRLPKPKGQTVGSFRKGLAMLPDAISNRLGSKLKLSWKLSSIVKLDNRRYRLTYETPEGLVSLQSQSVVMTVPSHVTSSLLRPLSTQGELVEAVDRDLRKTLINSNAKDPLVLGVKVWPQAIPQFLIGHFDIVDSAKAALKNGGFEGLFLGGNYVYGVALGRCVEGAYEAAAEVTDFLSQYLYK